MSDFLDSLLSDYNAEEYLDGYTPAANQSAYIPHNAYVEATIIGAEYDDATKTVKYSFSAVKPAEYKDIKFSAKLPLDSSAEVRPDYQKDQEKWEQRVSNSRKKFFAIDAALGGKIILAIQSRKPLTPLMVASHAGKKLILKVGVREDDNKIKRNYLMGTGVKGSITESTAGTPPAARTAAPVQQAPRPAAVEVTQEDDGDGIPF